MALDRPVRGVVGLGAVLAAVACGSTDRAPEAVATPDTARSRPPLLSLPRGDITPEKLAAWRRSDAEWARWTDPSRHKVLFIPVAGRSLADTAKSVRLEVLDWGGKGPAMVLLAGLGGTAHIYDDLAPQLIDSFRVIGITRRGHGASSRAADTTTYTLDPLAGDIRTALDSLGIRRASLVGHSIAGAEITRFAARWPDRVEKLVYLDAAHDFGGINSLRRTQAGQLRRRYRRGERTTTPSTRCASGARTSAGDTGRTHLRSTRSGPLRQTRLPFEC